MPLLSFTKNIKYAKQGKITIVEQGSSINKERKKERNMCKTEQIRESLDTEEWGD